jgi:hypothetical protein
METPERDFYTMHEDKVTPYFTGLFDVMEMWQKKGAPSKRAPGPQGMWLNFIVRKIEEKIS